MLSASESTVREVGGESERQYREVFENIDDCIFLIDVTAAGRFRIARFNPATERIFGQSDAKVAGKYIEDVLSRDAAAGVKAWYQRCVTLASSLSYDEHVASPRGDVWFETTLVPVKDASGRVHRIVGTTATPASRASCRHR